MDLTDKYAGKVKMIYIDPPYNTKNDGFIYNDNFNHSSWLTFIYNRLLLAIEFLSVYGVIFIQCDDNEQAYLKVLMDEIFGSENFIANLPTIMNLKGNQDQFGFAGTHEYILVYSKNIRECKLYDLIVDDPDEIEKWDKDEIGYYKQGANLKATGTNGPREKRPNLFFPIYIDEQKNVYLEQHSPSDYELYPITDGVEMSWRWQKSTMINNINDIIVKGENGNFSIYKKQRPEIGDLPTKRPKSLFYKPTYSSGNGTNQIKKLFGDRLFSFAKPEELLKDLIDIGSNENDLILDFFMGSATTQAVAMKMNRRFIGIEQMDYINSVSVPRLQKVIEGEQGGISKDVEWQGGGSFVYAELMEKSQGYIDQIYKAKDREELLKIYQLLIENVDMNFKVDLQALEEILDQEQSLDERKRLLLKVIDKNQLYYNYSEIDDANVRDLISDNDYQFNQSFYKEDDFVG